MQLRADEIAGIKCGSEIALYKKVNMHSLSQPIAKNGKEVNCSKYHSNQNTYEEVQTNLTEKGVCKIADFETP